MIKVQIDNSLFSFSFPLFFLLQSRRSDLRLLLSAKRSNLYLSGYSVNPPWVVVGAGLDPPSDFVTTKSHCRKAIMVLFPSEIRKIEIQFFGGRELPAQRIKIPMIAGGNHTSTNNDPPLQPVIDECTEQLGKLKFDCIRKK